MHTRLNHGSKLQVPGIIAKLQVHLKSMTSASEQNLENRQRFKIVKTINHGKFGQVFLAVSNHNKVNVAFKVVHRIPRTRRSKGPNVDYEPDIQSQLDHPNIVQLLEYWKETSCVCLVFELMDRNLSETLSCRKDDLDEKVKVAYMQMLLKAVSFIHQRSIIHRDIKPQNILLTASGVLKLGDFGLARQLPLGEDEELSSSAGTREYRAPEMLFGSRCYGAPVDIWACGCVCAEIYTNGQVLFGGADSDIGQLGLLIRILGDPLNYGWEDVRTLPDYGKLLFSASANPPGIQNALLEASEEFHSFVKQFLLYDPCKRITAQTSLLAPYCRPIVASDKYTL